MRIVSLIPAGTEIVAALGGADALVGLSHECDWPASVPDDLPRLTEPRRDMSGGSREIDETVRGVVEEGLSVYELDAERLAALDPDVVVTQDQCAVCAVDYDQVCRGLASMVDGDVEVVSLNPSSVDDVAGDFVRVGAAMGRRERAERARESFLGALEELGEDLPPGGEERRTVWHVEWLDPLMVAGHWVPDLVRYAGGAYPFGDAGSKSRRIEWDEVAEAAPEVVVVAPCGFDVEQTRAEMELLRDREGWEELPAVEAGRVEVLDGDAYFNRPGPRMIDSASLLAEVVWPEADLRRRRATDWFDTLDDNGDHGGAQTDGSVEGAVQ